MQTPKAPFDVMNYIKGRDAKSIEIISVEGDKLVLSQRKYDPITGKVTGQNHEIDIKILNKGILGLQTEIKERQEAIGNIDQMLSDIKLFNDQKSNDN